MRPAPAACALALALAVLTAVPAAAQVWVVTGMLRGAALGSVHPRPTPEEAWQWLASTLQERDRQR